MKNKQQLALEIRNAGFEFDTLSTSVCKKDSGKKIYFATLSKSGFTTDFVINFGTGFRKLKNHVQPDGEGFTHTCDNGCTYYKGNVRRFYSNAEIIY